MKKLLTGTIFAAVLTLTAVPANVQAETTNTNPTTLSGMLELLQSLMKQVEVLQKQLAELKGEIRVELKDGLREGISDEDVKKIQELLATDPEIYPKGLISGYYGPLTKEAVMRFQKRHGLKETGEVNAETKALIIKYFKQKSNGKFPPGLLKDKNLEKKAEWLDKKEDKKPVHKDITKTEEEAEDMIEEARAAIADLEEAIEENDDHKYIEHAEAKLEMAKEYLEYAEDYLEDDRYNDAYHKAMLVKNLAKEGLAKLNY